MDIKKMILILVVILVVLGALVFMKQAKKAERPSIIEQAKFEKLIPESLKIDNIVRIDLYTGAKIDEKVTLKKEGDKWRVSTHFNSPAKKETVEDYLDKIVKLQGEMRAEVPTDDALADYNLKDDQAFHLDVFTSAEGEPALRLLVGKSPNYQLTFVRKAGERKIYDGGVNFRQEAGIYGDDTSKAPGPDRWLDKDILKVEKDKITRLAYEMPDKKLIFERKEKEVPQEQTSENANEGAKEGSKEGEPQPKKKEYEWVLVQGGTGEKHKETGLQNLLGRFANLTASSIVDPAKKADWGLETPTFKLTISREAESDVVLEAGRPNPAQNGYIRVASNSEDIVYEVSKYTFEQIFPKGQDLFDLPSLNLDKDKIQQVTIEQPEGKVVVQKDGNDWKVIEPVIDLNVQATTLNTLTSALASWKASDYADNDVDVGEFNKKIVFKAGEEEHTFKVAGTARSIDGVYATLDDKPIRLVMNRIDANKILLKPRDVYELKILDFATDKVTSVEIKEGDVVQTLKKGEGGDWILVAQDGKETKLINTNVMDLLSRLSGLQGEDIRPDLNWKSFTPTYTMRINITDTEPLDFSIGQGPADKIVATVPRHKAIIQIAQERWEQIKNDINKAREPRPEETKTEQKSQEETASPAGTEQQSEQKPQEGTASPP
ncbi:MAG: DUF4340 domain-containing protein, partial [Candidatus Hydrogenedens sp.]